MAGRQGTTAFVLATLCVAAAAGFTAWAIAAPAYSDGATVWQVNDETTTRAALLAPLALTLLAWGLMRTACAHGRAWARQAAIAIGALFFAFSLLGAASIGLFVMPGAMLLLSAAVLTPVASSTRRAV